MSKDIETFEYPKNELNFDENDPKFEDKMMELASLHYEQTNRNIDDYNLLDIDITKDSFVMKFGSKQKEQSMEKTQEVKLEEPKEEPQEPQEPEETDDSAPKKSSAYSGPWGEKKFEVDVVQACAMMDVVSFTENMINSTGMVTPSILRSLRVIQQFCISKLYDFDPEEMKNSEEKQVKVDMHPEFIEHFKAWMEESNKLFEKEMGKKKIVQARSVPLGMEEALRGSGPGGILKM